MTMVARRVTRLIADKAEGERESRNNAALRYTLRPKVICGELRADDAEKLIERAVS